MPQPRLRGENNNVSKIKNIKTTIIIVVLLVIGIICWYFREYFIHEPKGGDEAPAGEHDINALAQKLFMHEQNHNPYLERVNFQGKTKTFSTDDRAIQPLLELRTDLLAADRSSTVYLMRRLFDNYVLETNVPEQITAEEQQEELDFLNAVLKTPPMKLTMQFLQEKGKVSADAASQLQLLKDLWFMPYSRGKGIVGSSGFEHVFLAEMTEGEVKGLHNWIYFSEQEQKGNLDYKGFIQRLDLVEQEDKYLLATRFIFHNSVKSYNTLFVGTTPEFELSIYTACFIMTMDECVVQLGGTEVIIRTRPWNWHGKQTIAMAYPAIK